MPPRLPFRIVDETDDWIVIDKPAHLQAHPSKPSDRRTLWDELRSLLAYEIANGGQVSIINRLDRETSGLTLVAKNTATARHFSMQMERRLISKSYLALVWGWPAQDEWETDAPLLRQGSQQPSVIWLKQMVHPAGVRSRTRFSTLLRFTNGGRFSLIRAVPETGRMHQIRVHLAHSALPVVGDKIYGPDERCYLEFIETGWTPALERRLLLPRHALHSGELSATGPAGQPLEWRAPLPPDIAALLPPVHRENFSSSPIPPSLMSDLT